MTRPLAAPTPGQDHAEAGHEHGQRGEHERRAEDGADADLVRRVAALTGPGEEDRHERDHCLGQRRAHGSQDAAHCALGQVQLVAEPLDAVGEQLGGDQNDHQRD